MPHYISETQLKKYSLFSIGSKEFGYGHYNRIQNLISILYNKNSFFKHYSFGLHYKNKENFLNRLKFEVQTNKKVILDISNNLFLDKKTILKIKKILISCKKNKIYIIDEPACKNLSTELNFKNVKTLIPFEVSNIVKKSLSKLNNKVIGIKYFIYPVKKIKTTNKKNDIILSFGGSDNYNRTFYVLKLIKKIKPQKNILVIIGKFFNEIYKKKIIKFCEENNFKTRLFSKNFHKILNNSKLLITNSGLTKYEGLFHGIPVIVFSDTKESQKIDKIFINKTNQSHFLYLKNEKHDSVKLNKILNRKLKFKLIDERKKKLYIRNIKAFFK